MSPYQRENSDPYRSERQPAGQPPQRANQPSAVGAQGGGHQGPPEQFSGQGSPQPNQQSPQQGQPSPQQRGQQASQQGQQSPQQGRQPQQGGPQQRTPQQQTPQQQPAQGAPQGVQGGQQPVQGGPMAQGGPAAGAPRSPGAGGPGIQSAPIEEVLQSDVVTAGPDEPLAEIAERMATEDVGCVVVVEGEEPVGVVTDRSIALALRETPDLSEATAGDLLTGELVTGTTEMTVFDVLDRLEESNVRRLPIVDEDGALEGIVTLDDVVVLLGAELSDVSSIVQTQSPRF